MDPSDEHEIAFNAPNPPHYGFEPLPGGDTMNLDFSPLPELEPLSGPAVPNLSASAELDRAVPYNGPRQAQRVPAMAYRRAGNLKSGLTAQRSAAKSASNAKLVTEQFGQATARIRSFEDRFSKLEKQYDGLFLPRSWLTHVPDITSCFVAWLRLRNEWAGSSWA